jgi:hypothetical protein
MALDLLLLQDGTSHLLLQNGTDRLGLQTETAGTSPWLFASTNEVLRFAMQKNVASQKIGAQLVSATDGSAFTGSVTVAVTVDAGTQATGSVGSGACTHEGGGYHTYAPAQAETNGDLIAFTFSGTGAVPVTVQVYTVPSGGVASPTNITAASGIAVSSIGNNVITASSIAASALNGKGDWNVGKTGYSLTNLTVQSSTTLATGTHNPQTGDSYARLGAPAGASVSADIADVESKVDDLETRVGTPSDLGSGATVAANLVDIESQTDDIGVAGAGLTAINLPDQTMNITGNITGNLSGSVGSVTAGVTLAASAVQAIWDALTSALTTVGSIGKLLVDNVNATISSRSSHTAANVRTEMDSNSTQLAAILADTNELQTDWANGGRLDLILDARASQTSVDTIDTEVGVIDGIVDAILVDTAEIGVAGAGLTVLATQASVNAIDDYIDTEVAALTTELAKVPKSDGTATWNATALASIQGEATDALNAYNPPTRTEATSDKDAILTAVGDVPTNAEFEARTLVAASYATTSALATVDTVADNVLALLNADKFIDKNVTPWALVYIAKGTGAIGVGTELLRQEIFDVDGGNLTATTTIPGRLVE